MKTQKIIEKQNELNKLYEKCLRYRDDLTRRGEIALSGDYIRDIEYANKLRKEIAQLKAEEEVSDSDIYKWASLKVNEIEDTGKYNYGDLLVIGAKAMRDGKIIHYDDGRPIIKI